MNIFNISYYFPNSIKEIDRFTGKDFEEFLFHFFNEIDLDPRLTNDSDDKGVDLMIKRSPDADKRAIGVQAKRWKGSVGPDEIRKMLDGKGHYNLEELWIITTSKLTSSARTTALNNRIKILDRTHVNEFLKELKKRENIIFRKEEKTPIKKETLKKDKFPDDHPLVGSLKKLRTKLAKENKIYPVYFVYNNLTIQDIVDKLPTTYKEVSKAHQISKKSAESFGDAIIKNVNEYKKTLSSESHINKLKAIRYQIGKYNNIKNVQDVFQDDVVTELLMKKPKLKADLYKIKGFNKQKVDKFGDYLIKRITEL